VIHPDIPRIGNIGLLLTTAEGPSLFHPGDSYQTVPDDVDVLGVPLAAPWAAARETVDFVRAVRPRIAVPIHDGIVGDVGRGLYVGLLTRLAPDGTRVQDLAGAGPTGF
jgi:L-ascorbate metabolism protein UlaG (beta-lactamase superfamily)